MTTSECLEGGRGPRRDVSVGDGQPGGSRLDQERFFVKFVICESQRGVEKKISNSLRGNYFVRSLLECSDFTNDVSDLKTTFYRNF